LAAVMRFKDDANEQQVLQGIAHLLSASPDLKTQIPRFDTMSIKDLRDFIITGLNQRL
jgi:hypothetical protein